MKLINKAPLFFLIILLIAQSSCNNTQGNKTDELKAVVDSLQSVYAPDKRVNLWMAIIENNKLNLWVENKKAFLEIDRIIKSRFPDIEKDIRLLPEKSSDQFISGIINNSVANLRSKPRHSSELATQALLGTPVRVFKKQGEWYLVQTPNRYIAWVDSAAMVTIDKESLQEYKQSKKVVFTTVSGFSYSEPNENSQTISDIVMGCILPALESKNGFIEVRYPDKRLAWVKQNEVVNLNELSSRKLNTANLLKTAKHFLGFPYLWGGTSSKAVDCSGFTSTVFFMNGIILQRDASQQTKYGKEITTVYEPTNLLPGDLLFFGRPATKTKKERVTHVAMYLSGGEFIHASGKVRINSMDSTKPNYIKSYKKRFIRAVRINGYVDGTGIELLRENKFYKEITE
jgi:cell wall-associated NlpC family hydrolase